VGLEFELAKLPHFQSILLWLFWRWGLKNYLPKLAENHDPLDLSLSSLARITGMSLQCPAKIFPHSHSYNREGE
jgi:hypothetical protein